MPSFPSTAAKVPLGSSTAFNPPDSRPIRRQIYLAAWCAAVLKIYCAGTTLGTVDVQAFLGFGKAIVNEGMAALYNRELLFNHTPLVGSVSALLYTIGGHNERLFGFLLRLPSIAADWVVVVALMTRLPLQIPIVRRALIVFALSPVSFMVSGFHGNVDPILVCLLVLAAAACADRRLVASAVFYGLACNIKVAPLLLGPVFLFAWVARGAGLRFAFVSGGVVLLGWAYPLIACPDAFLRNVLGYSGFWGTWGITYLLSCTGVDELTGIRFGGFTAPQAAIIQVLKLIIVFGVTAFAWVRRFGESNRIFCTIAVIWLLFMTLAPAGAPQYLVWPAPFLLFLNSRAFLVITAACSIHLFIFYTVLCGGLPWDYGIVREGTNPHLWLASSILPWAAFAIVLAWQARHSLRSYGADRETASP